MEQNDLLSLISQKHNDAFRYLYKNYYIALKAVANYYTKNEDISEDLVQDVFIVSIRPTTGINLYIQQ